MVINPVHPAWKLNAAIAEIPVLDWKGPGFLVFYGVAFVLTLVWSVRRLHSLRRRFESPAGAPAALEDPYETAYLAGGALRCSQLAVVRLLEKRALEWKKGRLLSDGRLVARPGMEEGGGMNDIEQTVYRAVLAAGQQGRPISDVLPLTMAMVPRIEARLARLGLRPTDQERSGLGWRAVLPMLMLAGLGVLKIGIGLTREKPVGFLLAAVFLTVIIALMVKARTRWLTASGERALAAMRSERVRHEAGRRSGSDAGAEAVSLGMSVALLGPMAVAEYASILPDQAGFRKELRQMGNQGCSSCGTSSGLDGSGGGGGDSGGGGASCGSGCGGCGGGGD